MLILSHTQSVIDTDTQPVYAAKTDFLPSQVPSDVIRSQSAGLLADALDRVVDVAVELVHLEYRYSA